MIEVLTSDHIGLALTHGLCNALIPLITLLGPMIVSLMTGSLVVEMGDAQEVYRHPLYPYMKSLVSAIPLSDPQSERLRRRIPCVPPEPRNDRPLHELTPGHFVCCANDERLG